MRAFAIGSVMGKRLARGPPGECFDLTDIPGAVIRRENFANLNTPDGRGNCVFDGERVINAIRCKVQAIHIFRYAAPGAKADT